MEGNSYMENSVRNIANKIAYACFVVVAIFILCSCSEQKKEEKDIPYFDDYVDFLLKYDVNTYDLSQYETYKNAPDVIEKLSESEKGLDSKTAFVKGIQSIMDGDNEEALNMFFKSLDLCKDEDEKIKLRDYCEIIQIYSAEGDIEKAKQYLKKFEDIYDTIPESEYCIDVVRWITNDVQNLPDDVDKVIDLIEKTRERAENLDSPASTQIVYRLARCYEINNENTRSMETLIEALRMAENDKDDYLAMFITVDLASAYLSRGNEEQAIEYLEGIEKYDLEDKGQEYEMKAYAKQNLAYVFYNKDDYEKAYQYAAESREYIEKEGDDLIKQDDILVNDVLMADILINQGKYEEGKELLDNAKDKYENSVKFSYVGFEHNINMTYGFYYRSIGDNDKALEYYLKIDNDFAGNEPGTYDYAYLCYIYEIYEDLGDYENAYKYLQKATDNMGAAYALAMDEQASYLLGEFQNEKKNQEIDYLKRKNSNATILLIFVAIVFIETSFAKPPR